jgi:protein dithiol oxidoreductase (disulfide-forming)
MKKLLAAFFGLAFAFTVNAAQYSDGKQYTTLKQPVANAPKIVEFFSFLCPHCYDFERTYHINQAIKESLPKDVKLTKYHVEFLGGDFGVLLTRTWAVAMVMGVEDKVLDPIFDGLQKTQTIRDENSLKDTFIKAAGITKQNFDAAWDSFAVKALVSQQAQAATDFKIDGVPAVMIDGKYQVNNAGLDSSSIANFTADFTNVTKFLLAK